MWDPEDSRSPVVTLVGDLSFFSGLASAVALSSCVVRRSPTLAEAAELKGRSLLVADGDEQIDTGFDGARTVHGHPGGSRSPILLLFRDAGLPEAALAYRDGPLDGVGAGISDRALALRLRSMASLAEGRPPGSGPPGSGSASLLAAVLEAPDGIALVSPDGAVDFANPALLAMLRAPDNRGAAEALRDLRNEVDDDAPFAELLPTDGTPWLGDLRSVADPPLDVQLAATARRLIDPDGTTLVILRDVTRERLLEHSLADAQRMDAVGQLAGGVAHDFNNILSVITTLSDLLMRLRPDDDPDREDLQEIFDSARRGSEIVRQLSAFSRPGQGEPESLELNTVVQRNEKMLRRLLGEGIDLSLDLDPDKAAVRADPVRLDQLILNLALNARDAMPHGGRFRIATRRRTLHQPLDTATGVIPQGAYAVLEVTDSGPGMEEAVRQRLFEPFFTTRGWGRHSGLGLSVVYGAVHGARGGIEVESELEVGTTFRILLPDIAWASESSAPLMTSAGETILLVEDHAEVRQGLARVLEAAGYRVVVAANGASALELLQAGSVRPHLVLSDVVMPSMNGTELGVRIHDLGLSARIVFMSGYPEHPEVDRLRRSGVQVLAKPIDVGRLSRALRARLDGAPAS